MFFLHTTASKADISQFIEENYNLLESMEVPIDCILPSQDISKANQ